MAFLGSSYRVKLKIPIARVCFSGLARRAGVRWAGAATAAVAFRPDIPARCASLDVENGPTGRVEWEIRRSRPEFLTKQLR